MTEASVHVNLLLLTQAFRRKLKHELVTLYYGVLDRAGIEDAQLDRATVQILENEKLFPVPATVLAYCRGERQSLDTGFLRGTDIRTRDFVRDHNRYADELCARDGFWKDADQQRRYELAAKSIPRSAYPDLTMQQYLRAIHDFAEELKPDGERKPEPRAADRPNRRPRQKGSDKNREVPF